MPAHSENTAIPAGATAGDAAIHLFRHLAAGFESQLSEVMKHDNPEAVHKARVALRRMRVVLLGFNTIIDLDFAEDLDDRLRRYFRVLGRVRDADVVAGQFATEEQGRSLAQEAASERTRVRKRLKQQKAPGLAALIDKRFGGKGWRGRGKEAKSLRAMPASEAAIGALDRSWTICLSNGEDLRQMSERAQHELRKDLKALRYLSEFFVDLLPAERYDGFILTLRRLQDDLGALNDRAMAEARGVAREESAESSQTRESAALAWTGLIEAGKWWGQARLP